MSSTATTLIQRARRRVGDWPERDVTAASMSDTTTSLTVTDVDATTGPRYRVGGMIEIGTEAMLVTAVNTGTNVCTVLRGVNGSTAAAHASGDTILFDPRFLSVDILDLINDGLDSMWPRFYQVVTDTSLQATSQVYEYTIPNVTGLDTRPIPRLHKVEVKPSGFTEWLETRHFDIIRGSTPVIKFLFTLAEGTSIRLHGYAPLPHLASSDTTHAQLPYHADNLAVDWAVARLLYEGEAKRVRIDTGVIDQREQANREGSSMRAAREMERMFYQRLSEQSMPPMSSYIETVL